MFGKKITTMYTVCWMLMIETTLVTFCGNSELKVEGKETGRP
jgi:hypothetical protein